MRELTRAVWGTNSGDKGKVAECGVKLSYLLKRLAIDPQANDSEVAQ